MEDRCQFRYEQYACPINYQATLVWCFVSEYYDTLIKGQKWFS